MTITSNIHCGLPVWQQNHVYSAGNRISNDTAPPKAYLCITGGTSQNLTSAGPKGTSLNITDGTAHWMYLSGIDYTSPQSFWNGITSPLTDFVVGSFWNDGPITTTAGTNFINDAGKVTGSFSITMTCASGESFRDKTGSQPLAFNSSNGVNFVLPSTTAAFPLNYFNIVSPNVIFDGLQFQDPNSASNCSIIGSNTGATGMSVRNCLLDGYGQSGGGALLYSQLSFTMYNTTLIDRTASPGNNTIQTSSASGVVFAVTNCTVVSVAGNTSGAGLLSNPTSPSTVKNSVFVGYTVPLVNGAGTSSLTVSNSAFTSASPIGANITDGGNNVLSITPANDFTALYTDFRPKLTSPLNGLGVVDTTDIPTGDDVFRNQRGSSWDMGAAEAGIVSKGQIPAITASGAITLGYTCAALVTFPTVSASALFKKTLAFSSTNYVNAVATVASFKQAKTATAVATVPAVRAAINARQDNRASASITFGIVGCSAVIVQGASVGFTAIVTLPSSRTWSDDFSLDFGPFGTTIRALGQFAVGNGFIALGKITLSASGTVQNPIVVSGVISLPSLTASAHVANSAPAAGLATITTMSSVVIANLAQNVSNALSSIPALAASSTAKQDNLFSSVNTLSIQAKTVINFVTAANNIDVSANVAAGQSNRATTASYIPGINCSASAFLINNASALSYINNMSAVITGYIGNSLAAVNTIPPISPVISAQQENFFNVRTNLAVVDSVFARFAQSQPAAGLAYITFVTNIANAGEEVFTSGSAHIPPVAANVQFVMSALATATAAIPSLTAAGNARLESAATAVGTIPTMFAVSTFGQSDQFTAAASIPAIGVAAVLSSTVVATGTATLSALSATVLAGQGNVYTARVTLSLLSGTGVVTNPVPAFATNTIPALQAQGTFGEEVLAVATSTIPGMVTVSEAVQYYSVTGTINIPPLSASIQAVASESMSALVTIPGMIANGVAYRGWVGTLLATIPPITASGNAIQTLQITGTNTLQLTASGVFNSEDFFTGTGQLGTLTGSAQIINANVATGRATIPSMAANAVVISTFGASALATIDLLVAGIFGMSTSWSSVNTLVVSSKGGVYSSPPPDEESEEVIYLGEDDRIIYITE